MPNDLRQQRILRRLRLLGEGPHAYFLDACRLVEESALALRSRSHLVSHLLRETLSSIETVLSTLNPPDKSSARSTERVSHATKIQGILKVLDLEVDAGIGKRWLQFAQHGLAGRAHRNALDAPRPADAEFLQGWHDFLDLLDELLAHFEGHFLAWEKTLDELVAWPTPGQPTVSRLRNAIPSNAHNLDYFFTRIDSRWLAPLVREEFFSYAPEPERDEEAKSIRFFPWPAGQYLVRMASADGNDALVAQAITQLETANPFAWSAAIDAALLLPVGAAAPIADHLVRALECPVLIDLPHKLATFATKLAEGTAGAAALKIAEKLLTVVEPRSSLGEPAPFSDAKATLASRDYGDVLKTASPALTRHAPVLWIRLLCDLLDRAVSIEFGERGDGTRDYSTVWQRHVKHHRNRDDLKNLLVTAVRESCAQALATDARLENRLLRTLSDHGWSIFRRLGLFVLTHRAQPSGPDIEILLTNNELWDLDYPEYRDLLSVGFGHLTAQGQETILRWIDEGPDTDAYRRWHGDISDEALSRLVRQWTHERLSIVEKHLPPERQDQLGKLTAEFGPASPLVVREAEAIWHGSKSPRSAEELGAMPIPDLLRFLATWEPVREPRFPPEPSLEGLGSELTRAVSLGAVRYSAAARDFAPLSSLLVSRFLEGLREYKAMDELEWGPTLALCLAASHRTGADEDRYCRITAAWLLKKALGQGTSVPLEHRNRVWELVEVLAADPDPDPEREAGDTDPLSLALNSVRPCGVEAAVLYSLWLVRHQEREAPLSGGRDRHLPEETARLLDSRLDPVQEPSSAVRNVIGRYLTRLHWLDPSWTEQRISLLFPLASEARRLWEATWDGYLESGVPVTEVWPLLRPQYLRQAAELAPRADPEKLTSQEQGLALHIGALLWRGEILPSDELVVAFLNKADAALRGWMIGKLGEALVEYEPTEATRAALRSFWDSRLAAGLSDPTAFRKELESFGSWWASGRFEDQWADEQLLRLASVGVVVDRTDEVFERLARRSASDPAKALELLNAVITDQAPDWSLIVAKESVEAVIRATLGASDPDTRRQAAQLVNRLVAWGYANFKSLLSSTQGE